MSALAFVVKSDSIDLLTDSLSLDVDDGLVASLDSKQMPIGVTAALAMNGWARPCNEFMALASRCETFDDFLSRFSTCWAMLQRSLLLEYPEDKYRVDPFTYIAAAVGWSESTGKPEGYTADSVTGQIVPVKAFALGGGDDAMDSNISFVRRYYRDPDSFDALADGVALFDRMRGSPVAVDGRECRAVGGSLQHTVITPAGIRSSIIHTWPADRVGEKLYEVN